ncbi:uncharacterized protein ACRADG_001764 isoform 2-T2 [Cochliomyia hominivorax]
MVIMKSCCFFKNVWNGSFACAIYTMIYFAFSSLILLIYVKDEWDYLVGRSPTPKGETIIEKGDITETQVMFNIIVLICSLGLVASSIIMLYGLKKDKREFLLPWILLMIGDVCVELFYAIYFIFSKRANFEPIVGFIFTIDLFIVCLNFIVLTDAATAAAATSVTEKPILLKTCQLHHSTTNFVLTTNTTTSHHPQQHNYHHLRQCLTISPIPEEDLTETHL